MAGDDIAEMLRVAFALRLTNQEESSDAYPKAVKPSSALSVLSYSTSNFTRTSLLESLFSKASSSSL